MINYDPTERAVARLTDAYLALVDPAVRVAAQRAGAADTWAAVLAGVATLTELIELPATDTGETAHPFTAATERGN
jgi:hypothetical protein